MRNPSQANKRILVDCHVFDEGFQGSRTFLKEIYSRYPDPSNLYLASHNTRILAMSFPNVPVKNLIKLPSKSKLLRLLFIYPYIIKKYKINIAHFQYIVPPIKLCRYIVTIHDVLFIDYPEYFPAPYRFIRNLTFRFAAKVSETITTVSSYSKQSIVKHFKAPENKIVLTPNGVEVNQSLPNSQSEARTYIKTKFNIDNIILYVSRVEPRKNHLLLIQAFVELELYKKGYNLVLIGNKTIIPGDLDKYISSLLTQITNSINWLSGISDSDLHYFYLASQLFVYPSLFEGFGIPPLEAASRKIPTICANTTSMKEFDFLESNLFDPKDKEALKKLILRNLEDEIDDKKKDSIAKTIKEKYNWEKSVHSMLTIIQKT